ncbi:MAG TPA: UDP-N-acetylmuramoyl-L-alanine--D-glutamate ligase, partial [Nitrosopumilaceae archaeon]|nr:UDP-N-acetylmuramoyl-L-alanine--D-glutamate ligase [Nitrosopumilaceae archaeon]
MDKKYRIGIWGFGKVGKSAAHYLHSQDYHLNVMDKRMPTTDEKQFLDEKNIRWFNEQNQKSFFSCSDFIISSPGVNISSLCYATHRKKWIPELDFFYNNFSKPIIAITGSIGKTSTTHILGQLFKELSISVAIGGNIGTPTFDLIAQQNTVEYALLEVSSFQLIHCTQFAPRLAIWTNFYPNHLDHHGSEQDYFDAKYKLLAHQNENSFSLVPLALRGHLPQPDNNLQRSYFSIAQPSIDTLCLCDNEHLYTITNNIVMCYNQGNWRSITDITNLPLFTFIENILLIISACDILHLNISALHALSNTVTIPEHRLEKCTSFNNIDFYNDSKATTVASSLAAVAQLKTKPLHLFIGGLSKGVDRSSFIAQLKNQVKYIYCFGKEAQILYGLCIQNNIPATQHETLEIAFNSCLSRTQSGDCVLLSPAGSSYDLYE